MTVLLLWIGFDIILDFRLCGLIALKELTTDFISAPGGNSDLCPLLTDTCGDKRADFTTFCYPVDDREKREHSSSEKSSKLCDMCSLLVKLWALESGVWCIVLSTKCWCGTLCHCYGGSSSGLKSSLSLLRWWSCFAAQLGVEFSICECKNVILEL